MKKFLEGCKEAAQKDIKGDVSKRSQKWPNGPLPEDWVLEKFLEQAAYAVEKAAENFRASMKWYTLTLV